MNMFYFTKHFFKFRFKKNAIANKIHDISIKIINMTLRLFNRIP